MKTFDVVKAAESVVRSTSRRGFLGSVGRAAAAAAGALALGMPRIALGQSSQTGCKAAKPKVVQINKLNQWLWRPQSLIKGTKMTFAGMPKAEDRADVIAYLETLK